MAASKDYRGIYVTRFFLGLFEAGYVSTTLNGGNADVLQMFTPILHNHCSVVPTIRTASKGRSLVRYQRYRYHLCQYPRIRSRESTLFSTCQLTSRATSTPRTLKHGKPSTLSLVSSQSHPHLSSGSSSTAILRLADS
jgi:hypothetical protein